MLVYFEWTDTSTTNTWPAAQGVTGRWQDAIRGHRARSSGGRNTSTVVRVSGMQWPPLQSVSELNKPSKPTKRGKEQAKQEGHATCNLHSGRAGKKMYEILRLAQQLRKSELLIAVS